MKDLGFFAAFFGLLIFFSLTTSKTGGLFGGNATSTVGNATSTNAITYPNETSGGTTISSPPTTPTKLSNQEIESRLATLYRNLDSLSEELRAAKLHEPISLYAGMVRLQIGNARETDPEREYMTLYASTNNPMPVDVSNWYLESYVTDERAALPQGDRVVLKRRSPDESDIFINPGEDMYVLTGESPLNASFHENLCTGYLQSTKSYYPYLSMRCPSPLDEMKRFGNIALDNDDCYTFVKRLGTCEIPSSKTLDDADINRSCENFVEDNLNYDSCVGNHLHDPLFDAVGSWRVYLERDEDLWRAEREIIRLVDENGAIVDVVEY